ncbi:MAG: hypothetical protein KF871_16575 [Hydrogenophaga sp.]|nr:hypothetical protein [Hydrogenophaga sp.]
MPVTFGQPFRKGDWSSTQGLVARDASGTSVPLQADELSTHADGSVRFAVLSAQVPNLAANTPRIINFYTAAKSSSSASLPANPNWNLQVTATLADGTKLVASPQAALQQAIASGANRRLNGSVASEFNIVAPMVNQSTGAAHPHLVARLHTRLYEGGARIRTDVIMENNWTFKSGPSNITYSLSVTANGQTLLSQPSFTHYHHARWHKVVWNGTAPSYRLRHNMPYVVASKAVLNYDLGISVPSTVLSNLASRLASSNTGPMGPALVQTYFPMTGARPDIAILPQWSVLYLITQDDRALAAMLANANAAAGVPVHYRDEDTDQPLSVETRPNVELQYSSSQPAVPSGSGSTVWTPDRAHQPSFAYLPYLITGDAFYLDEMMFWASWNIGMSDKGTRLQSKGLIYYDQTRAQAWSLRSIGEAAFAAPDSHPLKSYYNNVLLNNMAYYGSSAQYSPIGGLHLKDYPGFLTPWQSDFMTVVYSWLTENNVAKASDALNLIGKFQVGRFLNEANGYCPTKALTYDQSSRNGSGQWITTWSEMFNYNFASYAGKPCSQVPLNEEAYPSEPDGMSAMARASMASAYNAGMSDGLAAYNKVKSLSSAMDANLPSDPTWAIVPR